MRHDGLDRVESRVNRPVALGLGRLMTAVDFKRDGRLLWTAGAGDHGQRQHLDAVVRGRDFLVDKRLDILVEDVFLAVGEVLEALKRVLESVVAQLIAQVF